uniref:Phosphoglycerate mutase-like protein n=1 Tax=Leersia perrieri TaxID=77586 RepID=A0A0D9XNV9_9ORYZ
MQVTVFPSSPAAAPRCLRPRLSSTLLRPSPLPASIRYRPVPPACCSCGSAVTMADWAGTGTHAVSRREPEGERFVEVVVVRHGETSWNASRIVQGQMDPELNEIGRRQAVVVARRLSREARPAAVYSSDLKRAAETAEIIAKACGVSNLLLNEALRERHMGHLQGLKWDDAVNENPGVFKGFDIFEIKKDLDFDERNHELPGGGESLNQLSERCVSYLSKVAQDQSRLAYQIFMYYSLLFMENSEPEDVYPDVASTGERVIVVSHGAAIMELWRHTDPPNNSVRRKIPNTSLNIFRISSATGQWILEKCGDVAHLSQNDFLENAFGGDGASA